MRIASHPLATIAVLGLGVAAVLAGCGGAGGDTSSDRPAPGDGVLAVSNTAADVVYLRFAHADGSTITYRVDPGAAGRAEAADPASAPTSMQVLTAACLVLSQQADPVLGQLVIDGRSATSTAADDPGVLARPLLRTDDEACP